MHLELWMRGEYRHVQRFIEELSAKYLLFTYKDHDGKGFVPGTETQYMAQITVRIAPMGMYEIVFPQEYEDLVLTTVLGEKHKEDGWHPWVYRYVKIFRKLMKLEKIPDYNDSKKLPVFREFIEFIPIGIKHDAINAEGSEEL